MFLFNLFYNSLLFVVNGGPKMFYMKEKKSKKGGRNLYIPDFISEMLDEEGLKYEGPGTVASAAIFAFCMMPDDLKKASLKSFKEKEIDVAYGDNAKAADDPAAVVVGAEVQQADRKQSPHPPRAKSG
jgi:hypothetical protein